MKKRFIIIPAIFLFLSNLFTCAGISIETGKEKNLNWIDTSKESVVGLSVTVVSPPYVAPEKITVTRNPKSSTAKIEYSGLKVKGRDRKRHDVRDPGIKEIPQARFDKLIELMLAKKDWYREKPADKDYPSFGHGVFSIRIEIAPKTSDGTKARTIEVKSWYFGNQSELPSDDFKAIVIAAADLYKEGFGEEFYEVAHYD